LDKRGLLAMAMEREKGGYEFYSRAAEITGDVKGKEMFAWLAQQEIGHFNSLRNLVDALKSSAQAEPIQLSVEDARQLEDLSNSEAQGNVTATTTALEALQIAMDAERASIELYRRAERNTVDLAAKTMFSEMVAEEQAHLLMLEAQYQAVEKSQAFRAMEEFANL